MLKQFFINLARNLGWVRVDELNDQRSWNVTLCNEVEHLREIVIQREGHIAKLSGNPATRFSIILRTKGISLIDGAAVEKTFWHPLTILAKHDANGKTTFTVTR